MSNIDQYREPNRPDNLSRRLGFVGLAVLASVVGVKALESRLNPGMICSDTTHEIVLHDGPLNQVAETVDGAASEASIVKYVVVLNGLDTSFGTSDIQVGDRLQVPDYCD